MSLNGIQILYPNSLDGLQTNNTDSLYVNGQSVDPTNYISTATTNPQSLVSQLNVPSLSITSNTPSTVAIYDVNRKLTSSIPSSYISSLTSDAQAQINSKVGINGTYTIGATYNYTATQNFSATSTVLFNTSPYFNNVATSSIACFDAGKSLTFSIPTSYISNITSDIQAQVNTKASITYTDTQDNLRLLKAGDTMTGTLNMGSNKITSTYAPSSTSDLTNKSYVDSSISSTVSNYLPLTGGNLTGNLTSSIGSATDFGDIIYSGINNITTSTPTTAGLTSASPASGTLTYSSPTYTLTFTTQYMGAMWSNTSLTPIRTFFTFTNLNYASPSATITVCQSNTGNTAYTALTSVITLPTGTFTNYFVPNSQAGYTGQIFFLFTGAKFGFVSWNTFTLGYGASTIQGNQTTVGNATITGIVSSGEFALSALTTGSSGLEAELNNIINFGLNFRGSNVITSNLGGALRIDGRSGQPLFTWFYRPASGSETGIMNLTNDGNLGLVGGGGASSITTLTILNKANASTNYGAQLAFSNESGTKSLGTIAGIRENNAANYNGAIVFSSSNDGTATERMRITSGGNVGIGNNAPAYPLDVNNSIRSSSLITTGFGNDGYGQIRMIYGSYGAFWRNDGANTYFLLTNANDQYGQWNGYRPLRIENSTGNVFIEQSLYVSSTTATQNLVVNGSTYFNNFPNGSWIYNYPVCIGQGGLLQRGQGTCKYIINDYFTGWSNSGYNKTYAFYKINAYVGVHITGKFSCYTYGNNQIQPTLRIYSQNTGTYYYYTMYAYQNVGYAHTQFGIDIPFNNTDSNGWYDVYMQAGGNLITDGNDNLIITATVFSAQDY
jgi:hypothetical protein